MNKYIHVNENMYKIKYKRKDGKSANRYYIKTVCTICDIEVFQHLSNYRKTKYAVCSPECKSKSVSGKNNVKFKGRYCKGSVPHGHMFIYVPEHPHARRKYVPEHRLVVEKKLGRYLKPEERVHHINMVKDDNRVDNLHLFPNNSAHSSTHGSLNMCVEEMLKRGHIIFNSSKGTYEVT